MLYDRIVVGICNQTLSERVQTDAGLTLGKAKRAVQQKVAVMEQHHELEGAGIDQVRSGKVGASLFGGVGLNPTSDTM